MEMWDDAGQRPLDAPTHTYEAQLAGIEELVQHLDARAAGREPPAPLISPATDALHTVEILLGISPLAARGQPQGDVPAPAVVGIA